MSVDRWEALRELASATKRFRKAWPNENPSDRAPSAEFMDLDMPNTVLAILAERDALAEREGKLRQALRGHCLLISANRMDEGPDVTTGCLHCGAEWEPSVVESHAPDCLAKEPA
jgi:hypothetical protein